MAVTILSPAFMRHAAPYLLAPWSVRAASPYAIDVEPGHVTIARGGSQPVTARLRGFDVREGRAGRALGSGRGLEALADDRSTEATAASASCSSASTTASDYYVEAGGVRSPAFRIDVADVPYVKQIDLEYRFPAYTGLAPADRRGHRRRGRPRAAPRCASR